MGLFTQAVHMWQMLSIPSVRMPFIYPWLYGCSILIDGFLPALAVVHQGVMDASAMLGDKRNLGGYVNSPGAGEPSNATLVEGE